MTPNEAAPNIGEWIVSEIERAWAVASKPTPTGSGPDVPEEIDITPEMIEAGTARLWDLEGQAESASLVREVFLAMWAARSR
jgi:hypothetical protein